MNASNEIGNTLKAHPYQRFPATSNGLLAGVLTRKEAEFAMAENRAPKVEPAVTCLPHQTIRELQSKLIESTSLITIVLDRTGGNILGLVTLHDLLRAEMAMGNKSD